VGTNHFVKVFDLAESGFKDWDFAGFGLIFVAVGTALFFAPRLIALTGIPFFDFRSGRFTFFRYAFLGFSILWTVMAFTMTFSAYWKHRAMVRDNTCQTVEGRIEKFRPMPASGHADESFSVGDVRFPYSDYEVSDGFNNAAALGGPIRDGQYVRICYDPDSHAILRLEIRGYRGPVMPPSGIISTLNRQPSPPPGKIPDMPWYASLFVYAYFIDRIGQFLMLRPYLRRFYRLGRPLPVHAAVAATVLHSQTKVKLAHMLLQPDRDENALWLRPRGFNFLQLGLLAAKLNLDPVTQAVAGIEVRLSAGVPVILLLFFFGAFTTFAQVVPAEQAALFIAAFGVVALVGNGLHIRARRAQMIELVQNALPELA